MRNTLIKYLLKHDDKDTYFLTADVGYGVLEPLQKKMKERFINVGIAEQSMISIASGLALAGKKVYTYTMCAFYLRCLEQIKLDLCYQGANVTMIGVGIDYDYEHLGTTHFATEDFQIISHLRNIETYTIFQKEDLTELLASKQERPRYIRLSRFGEVKREMDKQANTNKYHKTGGTKDYFLKKADG